MPICCALADHLRDEADLLVSSRSEGRGLLADAAHHWRFDIEEAVAEGAGAAAFGVLAGRFPGGRQSAELHRPGHVTPPAVQVAPRCPLSDHSPDACLRIDGARLNEVAPPAVLFPSRCGSEFADL